MNFKAVLALPKTADSPQTHKSISFIWIVWSTLYVYLWSGARIYFSAEIQKYFVHFLVQMKTLKFAFEINWPLKEDNYQKYFLIFITRPAFSLSSIDYFWKIVFWNQINFGYFRPLGHCLWRDPSSKWDIQHFCYTPCRLILVLNLFDFLFFIIKWQF